MNERYRPEPTVLTPGAKPYAVFDTEHREYTSFHSSWQAARRKASKENRNHRYVSRQVERMKKQLEEATR